MTDRQKDFILKASLIANIVFVFVFLVVWFSLPKDEIKPIFPIEGIPYTAENFKADGIMQVSGERLFMIVRKKGFIPSKGTVLKEGDMVQLNDGQVYDNVIYKNGKSYLLLDGTKIENIKEFIEDLLKNKN